MPKKFIYQVLPRLWRPQFPNWKYDGSYEENGSGKLEYIDDQSLIYIKNLGANIIWLTGVIHHATLADFSSVSLPASHPSVTKGKAGSPYAIIDYYTISPTLVKDADKRMQIFDDTIKRIHTNDLKVLIDFVPNHVARQYHSSNVPKGLKTLGGHENISKTFSASNNFYYLSEDFVSPVGNNGYIESPAKATGNNAFTAKPSVNDWYETIKLNYGVDQAGKKHFDPIPETWHRMHEILDFWLAKGVDGFRCDMVEMVPIEFWAWVLPSIRVKYPNALFVAEAYGESHYTELIEAGFNLLYDKVNLYNKLEELIKGKPEAEKIAEVLEHGRKDQSHLLRFWENHDEIRLANSHFAGKPEIGIPAMVLATCSGTEAVMLYFGQELGEPANGAEGFSGNDGRSSIFDFAEVPSINELLTKKFNLEEISPRRKYLLQQYKNLGQLIQNHKAITEGHFYDLSWANLEKNDKVYIFLRHDQNERLLFAVNFSHTEKVLTQLHIPSHAIELLGITINKLIKSQNLFSFGSVASELQFYWETNGMRTTEPLELPPLGVQICKLVV